MSQPRIYRLDLVDRHGRTVEALATCTSHVRHWRRSEAAMHGVPLRRIRAHRIRPAGA